VFYHQEFGVDFGTDTIKIYDKREDSVTIEKNCIAVRNHMDVIAVGNEAYEMLNRTSADTKVETPVESGRIRDVRHAEAIIHQLLFKHHHYIGYRPSIYFAVPTDMTEIERRAYASIARRGKLKNCSVYLVEKPVADALALGLPIKKAKGTVMINMGAYSTTLSAIADGHVVLNSTIDIAGNSFDKAIAAAVRRKNRLNISLMTAEKLKKTFMALDENVYAGALAQGIDTDTGLPRNGFVTSSNVRKAVMSRVETITEELCNFMKRIPPQIRNTIAQDGIYLIGGSSHIKNLNEIISKKLDYPVIQSSLYENCTVNGLKEVISYSGANKLAYAPMQRK
jgi:rod shape-determining protein MreB